MPLDFNSEQLRRTFSAIAEMREFAATGKPISAESQKTIEELQSIPPEEIKRMQDKLVSEALAFIKKAEESGVTISLEELKRRTDKVASDARAYIDRANKLP